MLNKDTIGYTISMYGKSGGCMSTWCETLEDGMKEILSLDQGDHVGITIVKLPFKKRMKRYVITRPTGLRDSGIFTK